MKRVVADGRASHTLVSLKMREGTRADCASLRRAASYRGASSTALNRAAKASKSWSARVSARAGEGPAERSVSLHDEIPAISAAAVTAGRSHAEMEWREWCKRMLLKELVARRVAMGNWASLGLQG